MLLLEFIAKRLLELRSKHDLSQEQMAELLDTDIKWYQRIEWCEKDVRASTIDRLAAVFGVTAIQFLSPRLPHTVVAKRPQRAPHRRVAGTLSLRPVETKPTTGTKSAKAKKPLSTPTRKPKRKTPKEK